MPKIPKVQIPEKFKTDLYKRFDWKLIGKKSYGWVFYMPCRLCIEYRLHYLEEICSNCPLKLFETQKDFGCYLWLKNNFSIDILKGERGMKKKEIVAYCKKITSILDRYVEWI